MHTGEKASLTLAGTALDAYTLCRDNGGISGAGYLLPFTLQLRGPFCAPVRAGSHLILLSVPPEGRILALIHVFMCCSDYRRFDGIVKIFFRSQTLYKAFHVRIFLL